MKNIILLIFSFFIMFSCNNKEEYERKIAAEKRREIDSINKNRMAYNEKVLEKRAQGKYDNFEGIHRFTMSSDGISTLSGNVNFTKITGDEYEVSGSAKSGNNMITINGTAKFLGNDYISFQGEILQDIKENGDIYHRKGESVFIAQGKNKFWQMQDKVNKQGFVDYINIHF